MKVCDGHCTLLHAKHSGGSVGQGVAMATSMCGTDALGPGKYPPGLKAAPPTKRPGRVGPTQPPTFLILFGPLSPHIPYAYQPL